MSNYFQRVFNDKFGGDKKTKVRIVSSNWKILKYVDE